MSRSQSLSTTIFKLSLSDACFILIKIKLYSIYKKHLCLRLALIACIFSGILISIELGAQPGPNPEKMDIASLDSPQKTIDGQVNPKLSWSAASGAQAYRACIGTEPSLWDLYDSDDTNSLSVDVPSALPSGRVLYARLYTKLNGKWYYRDRSFSLTETSILLRPHDGAAGERLHSISWKSVVNASAYYLYIGSKKGDRDLFDGGETSATSVPTPSLPENQRVFIRINTKINGIWHYSDSSFTQLRSASLSISADRGSYSKFPAMKWDGVKNAQGYRLTLGTNIGTSDLWDTGKISERTADVRCSVKNAAIYARLYTEVEGRWIYRDKRIVVVNPEFVGDREGTVIDESDELAWAPIQEADAYYLYVGSQNGSRDLYDSGEIKATTASIASIPANTIVYARLNVYVFGTWFSHDFRLFRLMKARLDIPSIVERSKIEPLFRWDQVDHAEGYRLTVGSESGLSDYCDSGVISELNARPRISLPNNRMLFARLYTKIASIWHYSDREFAVIAPAEVRSPRPWSNWESKNLKIGWSPVKYAEKYRVMFWSTPDRRDVVDSGAIDGLSYEGSVELPEAPIAIRLSTKIMGRWYNRDVSLNPRMRLVNPRDGSDDVDPSGIVEWTPVWGADHYMLEFGTKEGQGDIFMSASIPNVAGMYTIPQLVPRFPIGFPIFGKVEALAAGATIVTKSRFECREVIDDRPVPLRDARWSLKAVRSMIGGNGVPLPGSLLSDIVTRKGHIGQLCDDYAETLDDIIREYGLGRSRILQVGLMKNGYDVHTVVEYFYEPQGEWVLLDPTFDLIAKRRADGTFASAEDISRSARTRRWDDIEYVSLENIPSDYYLDYPLMFLNLLPTDDGASILPYLEEVKSPVADEGFYLVKAVGADFITLIVDGNKKRVAISPSEHFSAVFAAATIELSPELSSEVTIYRLNRYVFQY